MHAGITVWWPGLEQRLYFETVLGDLLLITASVWFCVAFFFLVKDPPRGLVYNEIGQICCKHESFSLFITHQAAMLAHDTQPEPACVSSEKKQEGWQGTPSVLSPAHCHRGSQATSTPHSACDFSAFSPPSSCWLLDGMLSSPSATPSGEGGGT